MNNDEFLWTEKYRPRTIEDTILPEIIKKPFLNFLKKGDVPNLMLTGPAGCGKTTVAKAMLNEMGCDVLVINGSLNGGISVLRNEIQGFASSLSFTSKRKYVILDEADYLTQETQAALRNFMEEYSKNCGFILTCNFDNKIIEALHSRCSKVDFKINKADLPGLAFQFLKRCIGILEKENIPYDKAVLAELIKKHYPDWRRVLNELQRYSETGAIDSGILSTLYEVTLKDLMKNLKNKEFTNARKWVTENHAGDSASIFRAIYDTAYEHVSKSSVPPLVLILSKYQYQDSFVADKELNLMACLTELMMECEFL